MIRPTLLLSTALALPVSTLSVLMTPPALADPTADEPVAYASAGSATCGDHRLRVDLQQDSGSEPNLRLLWRIDGAAARGRDWHLPAEILGGAPVILDRVADHPKARLVGLGGPAPRLQLMGYDQSPVADCPEIALARADPPLAQYAAMLARFGAGDDVTPAVMATFLAAERDLPPAGLLPPLDRASLPRELDATRQRLLEGLARHVTAAPMVGDAASRALIEDLRRLWIDDPRGPVAAEVLRLARDAQQRYAIALMAAAPPSGSAGAAGLARDQAADTTTASASATISTTTSTASTTTSAMDDTTCRIMDIAGRSIMSQDHVQIGTEALLELAAGQPLIAWTRATADAQLAEARRCSTPAYAELLAGEWPRIEARAGALAPLVSWASERAALPPTLAAHDATGWLTDAPTIPVAAGLAREDAARLTEALREPLVARATGDLGAELALGVETLPEPRAILSHCRYRIATTRAPASGDLPEAVLAACEAIASDTLRAAADAVIARDLAVAEAAPATLEGALATNGYGVGAEIASWPVSAAQEAVMTGIRAAAAEARKPMEAKRDAVVSGETARLDAVVAALDPAVDTPEALPDCRIYDQSQSWLQPLHRQCRDLRLGFALRHSELRCERLFTEAEASDALRSATLDLGGGAATALRSLLCDNGLDARLDQRGGLLSARRHEVALEIGAPDSPMTLTGRLQVPEDGSGLWRLTGLEVAPGRLARHLDPDAPETLAHCLSAPDACAE